MIELFLLWLIGHRCPVQAPPAIPFNRATLCLDCSWITDSRNDHCEKCGSCGGSLLFLGGALDGHTRTGMVKGKP
jgi:hypothetical protein